ncbi:MAG: ABC transporter ATP-binding protein [Planctomycetes bacterium]|nr:ABC transporter ATP-binding protein [Planctomycetota bacterium]
MQLSVNHLGKQYATRAEPLTVLRDVTLAMQSGENAAILGPSGSGKSTLLQILGTLERPTTGSVHLDGVDPFGLGPDALARFRNQRIGFIFQEHHLLPQLSVLENILVPTLADGRPSSEQLQRAHWLIERVGLGDRVDHRPAELSGGERQRVAVARALIQRPALLLADEPTGSLDRTTARSIGCLLRELHEAESTMMVVVTHSLEIADLFQRRWELNEGNLCELSATGSGS